MKLFIISDIHGSLYYLEKALKAYEKHHCESLICLGDFYYHGPRNPLPKGYDPMAVSQKLNEFKDPLIAIRGNCDAEVDQMISTFQFIDSKTLSINDKRAYFHHGHHPLDDKEGYDIIFSGHTHVGVLKEEDGVILANPGSISLPKAEDSQGYLIYDETGIRHYDLLTDKLLKEVKF